MLDLDENDAGLVIAHLGNGASICAVQDGKSVDTSMGMTPLEGLIMGTRSGDVDFGALTYLADKTGQSMAELERVVNKESVCWAYPGFHPICACWSRRTRKATRARIALSAHLCTALPVTLAVMPAPCAALTA
ncbi:propionate kinase/acetate kinase C, anaerobic [Atlantibacter hermannii]|nr:propionate kinase/acetate kinase C, anaerobic [Atlantibacter hermannii]